MRNFSHRNAFTLIEILVVLIILSILAAMVTTAVSGVRTTAREARTKRIISVVDSVIAEHYEQLRYRPLPVEIPYIRFFAPPNVGELNEDVEITVGYEVLADEAARVRLLMLRDLQRMELPDRYSDIVSAPTTIPAAASPVIERKKNGLQEIVSAADTVVRDGNYLKNVKAKRRSFQVAWYTSLRQNNSSSPVEIIAGQLPPKLSAYRGRLSGRQTEQHQGAECLYLILSTSFVGGQPAIGAIPDSNIGDTDADGMPEILDGWGRPLQFVRWPVGFTPSASQNPPNADFELTVDVNKPDDFDLFRADYAYVAGSGPAWVTDRKNGNARFIPWAMKPLVFSLGEDGASGIAVNPGDQPGLSNLTFSYSDPQWKWPIDEAHFGIEVGGRLSVTGGFPFLDPYLRRFIERNSSGALPGELLGSSVVEWKQSLAQATDNITNYQLQVTP